MRFVTLDEARAATGLKLVVAGTLGGELTALDIYMATAIAPLAPMSNEDCPDTHPIVRHAFATGLPGLSNAIPAVLVGHRDRIYAKHLELPVWL